MKIHAAVFAAVLCASCGLSQAGDAAAAPKMDPETAARLQKMVTFNFAETPLSDSINFLNTLTKLNIIIDPKTAELQQTPITLRVQNMTIREALSQILDKAGMEAVPCDGALFLCKKGAVVFKKPEAPKPLNDDQVAEFKKALGQLTQDDFESREKASRAIANLGPGALALIDEELKKGNDAETHTRLKSLRDTLTIAPHIFDEPAEVTKALDALTKRLTFEFADSSLDECLNFLKTLGAGEIVVDGDVEKIPNINLRVTDMSLGMSLRWLARVSGMQLSITDGKFHLKN
jgi:hypothetical protein